MSMTCGTERLSPRRLPADDEFSRAIAEAVAMVTSEVRDPWADA